MGSRPDTEKIAGVILAAGFGERMLPLTSKIPKPLLPVLGIPLFEIITEKLLRSGASQIHSNLHHLADRIEAFASDRDWPVTFHREPSLLGTGSGVGNMARDLAGFDIVLLHNGDIVSSIDFAPAVSFHLDQGALITMILARGGPSGADSTDGRAASNRMDSMTPCLPPAAVSVTDTGEITGIGRDSNRSGAHEEILGYTGMAVLSREALSFFPEGGKTGLVEVILELSAKHPGSVMGYNAMRPGKKHFWGEAGSFSGYLDIHRRILLEKIEFDIMLVPPPLAIHVGDGAVIDPRASWRGFLEVGPHAVVGRDVILEDCVVLQGCEVPDGSSYRQAIIHPWGAVEVE